MKWHETFESYEAARDAYAAVVEKRGATRLDWGFGKWLWLEDKGDDLENWRAMETAGILTQAGSKMLARAEKKGGVQC